MKGGGINVLVDSLKIELSIIIKQLQYIINIKVKNLKSKEAVKSVIIK